MASEVEDLRARVAELERELAEQAARTNRLIAAAQERTYWLDRLGLDLDPIMRKPVVWKAYRALGRTRHAVRQLRGRLR
jgi:cell division septum initiation protein DivIVA